MLAGSNGVDRVHRGGTRLRRAVAGGAAYGDRSKYGIVIQLACRSQSAACPSCGSTFPPRPESIRADDR